MATDDQIQVAMKHSETKGIAVVAKSSFRATWRKNGWRIVDDTDSLDELLHAADLLGKDVDLLGDKPTKKAVLDLISPPDEESIAAAADTSPIPASGGGA